MPQTSRHSCNTQGLSYIRVVLSLYLCLFSFSFQLLYILSHYHLFFMSIPSIDTSPGKTVLFCVIQANSFLQFLMCSLIFPASPFLPNTLLIFLCFLYFTHAYREYFNVHSSHAEGFSLLIITTISFFFI